MSREFRGGRCSRLRTVEIKDFGLLAIMVLYGTTLSVIGLLILAHLRGMNRRLDRSDERAREYREVNRAEHGRLINAMNEMRGEVSVPAVDVSNLRVDVKVLLERSHRFGAESQNG